VRRLVTGIADRQQFQAFHPPCNRGVTTMNAGKPTRSRDRLERVARAMLGFALVAAVAWAVMGNNMGLLPGHL